MNEFQRMHLGELASLALKEIAEGKIYLSEDHRKTLEFLRDVHWLLELRDVHSQWERCKECFAVSGHFKGCSKR